MDMIDFKYKKRKFLYNPSNSAGSCRIVQFIKNTKSNPLSKIHPDEQVSQQYKLKGNQKYVEFKTYMASKDVTELLLSQLITTGSKNLLHILPTNTLDYEDQTKITF